MAEKFSGNTPYPRRGRSSGSNQRGLVGHAADRTFFESQREQSQQDKQKQIEKFRKRYEERPVAPKPIDLGNKELAAYAIKEEFQRAVRENKVVVLTGATGTGKSTQGIQFLIETESYDTYALMPRKIIVDNLGDRLREELSEHFGDAANDMIGIIHGERSERSDKNVATIMTAQTYVRMEKDISAKDAVSDRETLLLGDEIHETDVHTEIGVATAATAVAKTTGTRLVLASATMDEKFIQETFKELNDGKTVPIIRIEGRPHSVATSERPDLNAMEAYLEFGDDHEKAMIFTRGDKQIEHIMKETTKLLEAREKGSSKNVVFRKLISTLTTNARMHVFTDPVPDGSRLVIVSTPAGMSGITFPGNTLVIADGVVNRKELNQYGVEGLMPRDASQAEITQMFGRAARDVDGGVGILVKPTTIIDDALRARGVEIETPELEFKTFDKRHEYPPAQIYNDNLSRIALEVAGLEKRLTDLNPYLMHKVRLNDVLNAERNITRLGALDAKRRITDVGNKMDRYPLSPELSRGIVEASQPGRTLLHMARAGLIAVAIDAGGLQDFNKKETHAWDKLIRPTSKDDFITQLDIMTAIQGEEDFERIAFEYDLQPHRVEQVAKTVKKVFKILNIRPDNIVYTVPKAEEEELLRDDFTPGMINLVYEKSGRRVRVQQYVHILGNEGSTQREISDRSRAYGSEHEYLAGFPRYYPDKNKQIHEVLDRTLIVKPELVAKYAAQIPSMLTAVPTAPRMDGGRVVEQEQLRFGSIKIGEPIPSTHDIIPEPSRQLLYNRFINSPIVPNSAHEALHIIAKELDWYEKTIPKEELDTLRNPDAPALVTSESIRQLIWENTAHTRDAYVIDELLGAYIYSTNISIQKYYDQEVLDELRERSPSEARIGKVTISLQYENGQPYTTKRNVVQRQAPLSDFYLPDGREILIQIDRPPREGGKIRVSAKDLIAEAE